MEVVAGNLRPLKILREKQSFSGLNKKRGCSKSKNSLFFFEKNVGRIKKIPIFITENQRCICQEK